MTTTPPLAGTLGEALVRRRTAAGLTQRQLAKLAGISGGMLCHVELGKSLPRIDVAQALALALGCSLDHLVAGVTLWTWEPRGRGRRRVRRRRSFAE